MPSEGMRERIAKIAQMINAAFKSPIAKPSRPLSADATRPRTHDFCEDFLHDEEENLCDDKDNDARNKQSEELRGDGRHHLRERRAGREIVDFGDIFGDDVFKEAGQGNAFPARR